MTFGRYLKDRIVFLSILAVAIAAVILLVLVWGADVSLMTAIGVMLICAVALGCLCDYLLKRRFYHELQEVMRKSNGETYYATEIIGKPHFSEGEVVYEALERATKDMNDQIAEYRYHVEEYQEYIETWIHEVKTPLAAAHLILSNRNDMSLQPLEYELDKIEAYVEQTLFYTRSTAIEKDYALRQVKLDTLVKSVVKKHSRFLIEQGIVPQFQDLDVAVYTDPKWLDFVLGQIIVNAARYAHPPDTKTNESNVSRMGESKTSRAGESNTRKKNPTISFSARRTSDGFDRENVILAIADNGIGIPAHDIPRVFEKGFTGENGRLFAKTTGIGLYLCKKLCSSMKLRIRLESQEHEGTVVTIEFPLNKMYFVE